MTLSEVVRKFNATKTGDGYKALCSAHDDRTESLSISQSGDKILVNCFAGCDTRDVLSAVGLTLGDLYVNRHQERDPIIDTYEYRNISGVLQYEKQRTASKKFFFRKPDGQGGFVTSAKQNGGKPVMEGVSRLVYRMPQLRERSEGASTDMFTVFVVEGEKDANRLWSNGLPATTNDAGASEDRRKPKWTSALTKQLKDVGVTGVICLPDNDDAGRAHMQAVAATCTAMGIEARIVALPNLPPKGDVSDFLDVPGNTVADLLARCEAAPLYAPSAGTDEPGDDQPVAPIAPRLRYTFEPAFPTGHFVASWINSFSPQCDAAHEFHEAAALVALAAATPLLSARLSGAAEGLRTNLYVLMVGDAGRSRKSTAKNYATGVLKLAMSQVLLPEQMTQESLVESLTLCNGGAACWPVDEFTDTLSKLVNSTYLAGMRGLLLEMYSTTDYTYRRISKRLKKRKDDEDAPEREEDAFRVQNVTLSIIGCATPTIFQSLDHTGIGSGLLTRFAIVMPESKPARIPQYELTDNETIPSSLVKWLHDIAIRTVGQTVTFAPGVLQSLDEAIDRPLDEAADRSQMTVRSGVMARKIAMLSAAGRAPEFALAGAPLVVTLEDAEAAIRVATRWIQYAKAFEARAEETSFEVQLQKCAELVKGRTVNRRDIARRVHVSAKTLKDIEDTLTMRGLIEVLTHQPTGGTGRPSVSWRAL